MCAWVFVCVYIYIYFVHAPARSTVAIGHHQTRSAAPYPCRCAHAQIPRRGDRIPSRIRTEESTQNVVLSSHNYYALRQYI